MEEAFDVVFSQQAVTKLDNLVDYLANNWSQQLK